MRKSQAAYLLRAHQGCNSLTGRNNQPRHVQTRCAQIGKCLDGLQLATLPLLQELPQLYLFTANADLSIGGPLHLPCNSVSYDVLNHLGHLFADASKAEEDKSVKGLEDCQLPDSLHKSLSKSGRLVEVIPLLLVLRNKLSTSCEYLHRVSSPFRGYF